MLPFDIPLIPGRRSAVSAGTRHLSLSERLKTFRQDEDGALIVFTLFILLCMMLAIGMAIDTVRFEYTRTKLQSTLDRAVLAAADLDQTLTAEDVVIDYFEKAGLADNLVSVSVDEGINYRTVSATSAAELDTMFIDMVGIETLNVPASGTADESLADVEIVMVLDNSGSMGSNNDRRLNLLKPAARDFIDSVARDPYDDEGTTAISIVPFATQVSAGKELLSYFNTTGEHDYSYCVTFDDDDFKTFDLSLSDQLQQTGHFDADYTSWTISDSRVVCSPSSSREITTWSTDATYLKGRITAMEAAGWTSIEIGTKWGATLLNPDLASVVDAMADKGLVEEELRDLPFSYNRPNSMKVLVVMSDGENTNQYDIKDPYRSGTSPVYYYEVNGYDVYSYYRNRSGTTYDYYWVWYKDGNTGFYKWETYPYGEDQARRLSWTELWADMTVEQFTESLKSNALGGSASTYYDEIVTTISSSTKNPRTSNICNAAKNVGVTIFTIGMDTYGQGDATLSDCASSPTYFYDVRSDDLSTAFAAVARQINQLRLTQ